jgi:integrase
MPRPRTPIGHLGTVTVRQRGPHDWVARGRYRAGDGNLYEMQRAGRSKTAAQNALKEAARDVRSEAGSDLHRETRLRALAEAYLDARRSRVEASSLAAYQSVVKNHIVPDIGGLSLAEASVSRLQRFIDQVAADHGPSAAKMTRKVLSGMFGLAVRAGAADRNPVREIEGIGGTRGGGAKALSSHELRRFLTVVNGDAWAIEHDLPALIMFMAATGARIGEACAVRWEDVDLETGTVTIAGTVTRIAGQGLVRKTKTKTAAGARTLALATPLVGMLVERRVQHHAVSTGIVFPSPSGKLRDPSNTQHDLAKLRDRLGFPDVQWHSFRKTVATALKDAGVDPRDRADYLGHQNVDLTLDVYTARGGGSGKVADVLSEVFATG